MNKINHKNIMNKYKQTKEKKNMIIFFLFCIFSALVYGHIITSLK